MRVSLLMLLLILPGCGSYYPTPEAQTGVLYYKLVDSQEEVEALCGMDKVLACASPDVLIMNRHDWEHWITHEMAHVFKVLDHD